MIQSIKSLTVAAALGLTACLAAAHLLDEEVPKPIVAGGVVGSHIQCGAQCPTGWKNAFTCMSGQTCCGWYWCDSDEFIGQCCTVGQYCNLTGKPYQYQCVANP